MKRIAALVSLFFVAATPALAHGTGEGFVLLLPARYYLFGAALAVAASFLLLTFLPRDLAERLLAARIKLLTLPVAPGPFISLLSAVFLVVMLFFGYNGTRDPLANGLPVFIWVVWWIAFTLVQVLTGDLWGMFNPWSGVIALLEKLTGGAIVHTGRWRLPTQLGYSIAMIQFFGFAWFELVDLAPYDPERLAIVVLLFWLFNFVGMLAFGVDEWRFRAEPFSIFFRLLGALSPLGRQPENDGKSVSIFLGLPGRGLATEKPLSLSGSLFVLLTLSTVSFDGLSHTFFWVSGVLGINPLEFPGRSAVVWQSTAGLVVAFIVLSALFYGCVLAGLWLTGSRERFGDAAGRLIYSVIPISFAFHAAHYFTYLLVEGQYALIAASDPFGKGWNLFGTINHKVTTSFFYVYESVLVIWNIQTVLIVIGHMAGIVIAHLIAFDLFKSNRQAMRSQLFMAALMVFYTVFGLWLLATPNAG